MNQTMTFIATGDSFITRRLPGKSTRVEGISELLKNAEVRFTNLEVTTHDFEGIPGAVSGGTWGIASPNVLKDIKELGFNLVNWANNHTLDYSIDGMCAMEKYLNQYEFVHAGAGCNLARASEPRYLEAPSGRVALIAATSTFHESWMAGEQRPDMIGRPGVNGLRHKEVFVVSPEKLRALKEIADKVPINAVYNRRLKQGIVSKSDNGLLHFGKHLFKEGELESQETTPNQKDMARIVRSISQAKRMADYVVVSIHSHEMNGEVNEEPANFLVEFARKCIDEGAHAVIGHGPHILRGIEIYKQRPIFYSLGNFIFQNNCVSHLPADFYEKYNLEHINSVADAFDARSANGSRGFAVMPEAWQSIIPYWTMENGILKELTLYPIELGFGEPAYKGGWPALTRNSDIIARLQKLSAPFGTVIEMENGIGKVTIEAK
jgi:poly-gamma-glutamate capsule biosynthesis protein CapA/YwtB (metallophosphatase superfamily)